MALYRIASDTLEALPATTFSALGIKERMDLQRLLRANIAAIAPDCMVLDEEFGQWQDSKRRIDLLGLDRNANLVVIELKRDEDGGHMELQALRYAAMVSAMTFQEAVEAHGSFLRKQKSDRDARTSILEFLGWASPDENAFAKDVRILLAAADFSRELTTSVLWLNERELDVRCVRIRPYRRGPDVFLDIQQVIPLPEAADYQVQLRQKVREERAREESYKDLTRYDLQIGANTYPRLPKRALVFRVVKQAIEKGATPETLADGVHATYERLWREAPGNLSSEEFVTTVADRLRQQGRSFDPRRFFCDDEELFHVNGNTYALSNQWGGQDALDVVNALVDRFGSGDIHYLPSTVAAV